LPIQVTSKTLTTHSSAIKVNVTDSHGLLS
jgi:hypothetical protein